MIKNLIFTGDTHGGIATVSRIDNIKRNMPEYKPEETMVVILGDAGLNFWLNNTDKKYKKLLNSMNYHIYCVRGNHEQRPELVKSMVLVNDENVNNIVYMEEAFPNIRYFVDGNIYNLLGYKCLVVGGAYSIDKWYRLARAGYSKDEAETADPKKCGWFKDECLTTAEMATIMKEVKDESVDFVLSHTCPLSWMPHDLFLPMIDQSKVDYSMENYLEGIRKIIGFEVWCFAHYHCDRLERPNAQIFFQGVESMDDIFARATQPATAPDYKHIKSPNYYMEDN